MAVHKISFPMSFLVYTFKDVGLPSAGLWELGIWAFGTEEYF